MNDKGRKKNLNCGKCVQRTKKKRKGVPGTKWGGGGGRGVKLVSKAKGKCK